MPGPQALVRLISFALLLSTSSLVSAAEVTKEDLKTIEHKLQSRDAFEVTFTQIIKTGLRKRESSSRGRAVFGRPNLFRWVLEYPTKQEMVFNGQHLVQYDVDAKAATRLAPTTDKRRELEEVIAAATSVEVLLTKYDLEKSERDASGLVVLHLKPKRPEQGIRGIVLKVSVVQNFVEVVKLDFSNGSTNTITFANPQPIRRVASTFEFSAPAGVRMSDVR